MCVKPSILIKLYHCLIKWLFQDSSLFLSVPMIDEVWNVPRQRIARRIGQVVRLTCVAIRDALIQEAKVRRCYDRSRKQRVWLMMDTEGAWMYNRDDIYVGEN